MAQDEARASWSGKWAFILSAAASAVGLGNMWRFPYLAAKYGGGTFLLVYLLLVFTVGVSLLLLETALGRKTGKSAIKSFSEFGKKYSFIGFLTSAIPFIIVPYYCVIGGWVIKYMIAYLGGGAAEAAGSGYFADFVYGNLTTYPWMLVFIIATFAIVSLGVKGGIEKANLILMPALIVMAVAIAAYTLTLPGAVDGAAYYLLPDFSKLSIELVISALGQTFFSLSLAMGIMITYGSYLEKKESLTSSVVRIGGFSAVVSLLAGLMVVPGAFAALGSGEAVASNAGPSLMFIILPGVFENMGGAAHVVGTCFFVLVFFAALTSAMSLVETCVSILQDAFTWSRTKALIVVFAFVALAGSFVNAGYNVLLFIEPLGAGTQLLDLFDFLANSVMMPIAALLTCIFVGWIIKPQGIIDEVKLSSSFKLEKAWTIMIKFIAPVMVIIILIAYTAAQLGFFSM